MKATMEEASVSEAEIRLAFPNPNFMPLTSGKVVIEHGCWRYLSVTYPYLDNVSYPGDSNLSTAGLYGYPDIYLE